MAAVLFRLTSVPVLDDNGDPVSGALANFYLSGTLTRTPVYSDSALTTEHTNPVEANSAGVLPAIYLDSDITYRLVLTDADGVTIQDSDPYADLSAQEILDKLLTVDGSGSGVDADLVRGTTPGNMGLGLLGAAAAPAALALTLPRTTINASNRTMDGTEAFVCNVSASSRTITIPPQSSVTWANDTIVLLAASGVGSLVVARGSGVQLLWKNTDADRTIASGTSAWLARRSSDVWDILGSDLS